MTTAFAAGVAIGSLAILTAACGTDQPDQMAESESVGSEMASSRMSDSDVPGYEVPRFEVDPDWPSLPNGWELGITSSITVDQHDHVWILQRPRILHHPSEAPPVLEIDADGNFVQGWGGLSDEYDWPHSEHGIAVDDPPAEDLERMAAGQPGDFREPHDLATDSRGNLYVAEVGVGARAQKLVYKGLM